MRSRSSKLLGALYLMVLPLCAQAADAISTQTLRVVAAHLETVAQDLVTDHALPGVSIAAELPDGTVIAAAAGYADVEAEVPLTPTHVMPGGSTGKSYVATLAMMLVGDGVLRLDEPISTWLGHESWFDDIPSGDQMTLDLLLAHRTGLRDHVSELDFALNAAWKRLWGSPDDYHSPVELVGYVADESLQFEPGNGFGYTDTGYLLVGLIIEAATGRAYYDLLVERILAPLGLNLTIPAVTRAPPVLAAGYASSSFLTVLAGISGKSTGEDGALRAHPMTEWTGGGLFNTPSMLVRFYSALARGYVVPPNAYQHMVAQRGELSETYYGYGLYIRTSDVLGRYIGHGGWYPGYSTSAAYFADHGIGIAIQVNADGEPVDAAMPMVGKTAEDIAVFLASARR